MCAYGFPSVGSAPKSTPLFFVALFVVSPVGAITVALAIGTGAWFAAEFGGKKNKKKSGVLFGALPTDGKP
jgi:ABC-type proline/glycine betaine transport system permease subunit